jgi:spoIIIJ-associated protein
MVPPSSKAIVSSAREKREDVMNDSQDLSEDGWDSEDDAAAAEGAEGAPDSANAEGNAPSSASASENGDGDEPGRRRGRREEDTTPPDERSQLALDFVTDVIEEMEMDCRVRLKRPREGNAEDEISIEIAGRDAGRIIGKKGQVLAALQFLTHRVVNRPGLDKRHVTVDAEGYRSRRDNSLATMARRLGRQAVEEGKIITFEPMNPRDRRVVHLALAKFEGVITRSEGEGDDRRVQIIPVRRPSPSAETNG